MTSRECARADLLLRSRVPYREAHLITPIKNSPELPFFFSSLRQFSWITKSTIKLNRMWRLRERRSGRTRVMQPIREDKQTSKEREKEVLRVALRRPDRSNAADGSASAQLREDWAYRAWRLDKYYAEAIWTDSLANPYLLPFTSPSLSPSGCSEQKPAAATCTHLIYSRLFAFCHCKISMWRRHTPPKKKKKGEFASRWCFFSQSFTSNMNMRNSKL